MNNHNIIQNLINETDIETKGRNNLHVGIEGFASMQKELSQIEKLTLEIQSYTDLIGPNEKTQIVRLFTISRINSITKRLFLGSKLKIQGSFKTRLYLPTSDVDLVVLSNSIKFGKFDLFLIEKHLLESGFARNIRVITNARVPILKFFDVDTGINVDLALGKTHGVKSAEFVNEQLKKHPGTREIALVLKSFVYLRGLNEVSNGGLGSYALVLMLISFVQMHPKLRTKEIDVENNLGVLLIEFFELYGYAFNYNELSIHVGKDELSGYYARKTTCVGKHNVYGNSILSIFDHINKDKNISKASHQFDNVKYEFMSGYNLLTAIISKTPQRQSEKIYFLRQLLKNRACELIRVQERTLAIYDSIIAGKINNSFKFENKIFNPCQYEEL